MNLNDLMPIILAVVGSAGLWGFLSQKSKLAHERSLKSQDQHGQFNDTLKSQVSALDKKVDKLVLGKEDLLKAIADLRAELAEARVTVQHLESIVRSRG